MNEHRRPETRCRYLVRDITPLVSFFEQFRPSCRTIHINRQDWQMLCQAGDIARKQGFVIDEQEGQPVKISYHGFSLEPVDLGQPHR